jgi:hypothetical protein
LLPPAGETPVVETIDGLGLVGKGDTLKLRR